jgi:hypothetical protein
MIRRAGWAALVCALIACGVTDAHAQMSMGPFHGYLTGHIGGAVGGDVTKSRRTAGGSVAVQETTGWGAEFDFGRATDLRINNLRLDVNTYMFNAAFVTPYKRIRPFAVVGAGIYEATGCRCAKPSTTYDLGVNGGGGVFLAANDVIGVRADARVFWTGTEHRDLGRPDHITNWRLTVGVTYMWSITP